MQANLVGSRRTKEDVAILPCILRRSRTTNQEQFCLAKNRCGRSPTRVVSLCGTQKKIESTPSPPRLAILQFVAISSIQPVHKLRFCLIFLGQPQAMIIPPLLSSSRLLFNLLNYPVASKTRSDFPF
ncbi:hypothetical protein ABW19_dt0203797 [Dactylella cylindrospora]|nr:hypothetical protein ABW19_dt0203797 [Dactylella cylindrospora]